MRESAGPQQIADRPVQFGGSRLARAALRLLGWRLEFDGLPARQGVVVVYPHTSNRDFGVGVLAKWAAGIPVVFWGKDSLFRVPVLGRWLRSIGGVPVDRRAPGGIVDQTVRRLREARERDEFYWLALAHLDFARRSVGVRTCLWLAGDAAADMAAIARHFDGVQGYRAGLASPIRPS
jgi:hypothetical protein